MMSGLSACGSVNSLPRPPADKLVCASEPLAPARGEMSDAAWAQAKADYLTALWSAWADCHAMVLWHRDMWERMR